jgi:hypothetical protein
MPLHHKEMADGIVIQPSAWGETEGALALMNAQLTENVKAPGVNSRPLPAWGMYARHVGSFNLADVRLSVARSDLRPALICDDLGALDLEDLRMPRGATPMKLKNVRDVSANENSETPMVVGKCSRLSASPDGTTITATVQSDKDGLAKIELRIGGKAIARWAWLTAGKSSDVDFNDLPRSRTTSHAQCDGITLELKPSAIK